MGKNKNRNRNKNRDKRAKDAGGDDGRTSQTPATNSNRDNTYQTSSNVDKTCGGETKTLVDEQKHTKEPEETGASDVQVAVDPEAPTGTPKAKRDSVISNTSEGPADKIKVAAQVAPRAGWNVRVRRWLWLWWSWPCRLLRWTYRFLIALVRIYWNDQRRVEDVLLTVGLGGSVVFGVYLVVDFLVKHSEELMAVFPAEWFLVRHG
ncbi:hypothetical protein COCSADRAFT_35210 [Bipolaris sorokiniana ND90Pr]|uniref:Uncharacterized protein n=1 Tax=Cochliobolus sativus (strain ND90Pr / ATCC 201652) TaxID=665912 RepID=M2TC04_COCSN|nr:uncharacterized protein COCSADRAFT_35210 [Bipolaris sorokiniana ND90Pr]EMD66711.1 hypothetical protein COCSADRAFT_35210 [Bipolaris sorokiniana ND90Pr]